MNALIEPQLFVTAKAGERSEACQDVGWFAPTVGIEGVAGFAVADGATGGWDGQRWAELTVAAAAEAIVEAGGRLDARWIRSCFADGLERARADWLAENSQSGDDDDPISALARTKFLATGGHCTLTAGVIGPVAEGRWRIRAISVGDSPLVHLRPSADGHRLVAAAPLERSDQFDANPRLVSSRPAGPGTIVPGMTLIDFELAVGDCILVMTDALAAWSLRRDEEHHPAWDVLVGLDLDGFDELIERTRSSGELVDDDVLLLRLMVAVRPFRPVAAVELTGTRAGASPGEGAGR